MPSIVCKCGPAFTQNLFTILGILLVLALVVRFFSKQVYPELWDKLTAPFNPTEVEGPTPPPQNGNGNGNGYQGEDDYEQQQQPQQPQY